jgi:anti-anti-sigma factor
MAARISMTVGVERRDEIAIITPVGRISEMEVHQLSAELTGLAEDGVVRMVLDFAEVEFVTSACLGVLMAAHKLCRGAGGWLHVARPQPLVRQILEITKLVRLFGIYDSVDEAATAE